MNGMWREFPQQRKRRAESATMTNEPIHPESLNEIYAEIKPKKVSLNSDDSKVMRSKPSIHSSKKKGKKFTTFGYL